MPRKDSKSSRQARLRLGSTKQRAITHHYGRPIRDVVASLIDEGLNVGKVAARISEETGIQIRRSTLYRWLHDWQRA